MFLLLASLQSLLSVSILIQVFELIPSSIRQATRPSFPLWRAQSLWEAPRARHGRASCSAYRWECSSRTDEVHARHILDSFPIPSTKHPAEFYQSGYIRGRCGSQLCDIAASVTVLTPGYLALDVRKEGIDNNDKKMAVSYYGRWRTDDSGDDAPQRREGFVGLVGGKERTDYLGVKKPGAHTMLRVATLTATYTGLAIKMLSTLHPKLTHARSLPAPPSSLRPPRAIQ
ncbi:hypothetical protein CPB85DRAFT_1322382 [Mucidula mucida]|nr:hypothetical protein CPB85DRAFT_1322382 [Mucidula mucida]